ncbi:MAG: tetratricopeptide repeat protein [Chloroflexi bacterium]|nr:tetratricopeptide repeat protein [Chloroflexota bacterium]
MVATRPIYDKEPTPEFNDRCLAILRQWEAGTLPFQEASQQLSEMAHEANDHLANLGRVEILFGVMQGYRGNLNVSIQHFQKARDLFAEVGNDVRVIKCDLNLGESYRQKGDFAKARELFQDVYETATRLGDIQTQAMALGNAGQMLLSMKQVDDAETALKDAIVLAGEWPPEFASKQSGFLCEVHHALAVVHLSSKRMELALGQAQRSLYFARISQQPLSVGFANRTMGEVMAGFDVIPAELLNEGFSADPGDYFRAALEAFTEIDAQGERARTMHAHAKCLAKQGRRIAAARMLQQAMLTFAELGMVDDSAKAAESQAGIF